MKTKIKTVQQVLKKNEMLLVDSSFDVLNILDCTKSFNFSEYDMHLLIGKKNVYLICENLLYPFMKDLKGINVVSGDMYSYLRTNRTFAAEVAEILAKEKILKLGLTNPSLSKHFKNIAVYTFVSPAKTLSIVKSESEIKRLKRVLSIVKRVNRKIEGMFEEGMTDVLLRNRIDEAIYAMGSDRRFVPTMVGFDSKTQYPSLTGEKLKKGAAVLIDFGAMKAGAGINLSRTILYMKADAKKKRIAEVAKMALDVMAAKCFSGAKVCDIDSHYRHFLKAHRLLEFSPDFSVKMPMSSFFEQTNSIVDKTVLYTGSVVKLSANIFIPGEFGVREDGIYLIKQKGAVRID